MTEFMLLWRAGKSRIDAWHESLVACGTLLFRTGERSCLSMRYHSPSCVLTESERLEYLVEHIFKFRHPSRFAQLEVAPVDIPIDNPREVLKHEEEAAYLYGFSRESSHVRDAVKALRNYNPDPKAGLVKVAAEKALALSEIKKAIVYSVMGTSFPCSWVELPVAERQRLTTLLPHAVHMCQKEWPLNFYEADVASPELAREEWSKNVVAPVGQGIVRIGHLAINLAFDDSEIRAEFQKVLDNLRQETNPLDVAGVKSLTKKGRKGWGEALYQLEELRTRCKWKQEGKQASIELQKRGGFAPYKMPSDSNAACEAAEAHFAALFGTEQPIHHDWRSRPAKKKKDLWWLPPSTRKQIETARKLFASTHVGVGQDGSGNGTWERKRSDVTLHN